MDIVTTLLDVARSLYDASQEVKENSQACVAIQQTVGSLAKAVEGCTNVSKRMEEQLSELIKYINTTNHSFIS